MGVLRKKATGEILAKTHPALEEVPGGSKRRSAEGRSTTATRSLPKAGSDDNSAWGQKVRDMRGMRKQLDGKAAEKKETRQAQDTRSQIGKLNLEADGPGMNQGKQQELARLNSMALDPAINQNPTRMNQLNQQMKGIRAELGKQTVGDRVSDMAGAVFSSSAAGVSNLIGTAADAFGRASGVPGGPEDKAAAANRAAHYREMLKTGRMADGSPMTPETRRQMETLASRYEAQARVFARQEKSFDERHPTLSRVKTGTQGFADQARTDAGRFTEQAKQGLGAGGQLAVDVGIAGGQMGVDALAAYLTGGSSLFFMGARSAGDAMQRARLEGADLDQQLKYGLGSAALSVGTEKIANIAGPFRKMYGAGAAETIAGKLADRFGESGAVKLMTDLSKTAGGRIALSAIGEGFEEGLEGILQPVLQRATYDPDAKFDAAETGRDALIGAILGGIGGAVDVIGNSGRRDIRGQAGTGVQTPAAVDPFLEGFLDGDTEPAQTRGGVPGIPTPGFTDSPLTGISSHGTESGLPELYMTALQDRITPPGITAGWQAGRGVPGLYQEYFRNVYGTRSGVPLLTERSGGGWERGADVEGNVQVPMRQDAAETGLDGLKTMRSAVETEQSGAEQKSSGALEIPVDDLLESDIIEAKLKGGALDPQSGRAQVHAERYYQAVRKMTTDVRKIAENTGYPVVEIRKIKDFIFMEEHDLGEGKIAHFDACYEMAESWQRLIDGRDIQPHDLTLLRHEIMERKLMAEGYTQDEAHTIVSRIFNYSAESREYYYGDSGKNQQN